MVHRRQFIQSAAAATLMGSTIAAADGAKTTSFVLLGDLHYDKIDHHDLTWLDRHHPQDLNQIKNYSRITTELTPQLFAAVRRTIVESRAKCVLQVGDLVEGLCGSEELALRQNREALEFVAGAQLGVPFLFTKGNHDVAGDGSVEAFRTAFHPFLDEQLRDFQPRRELENANYTCQLADALLCGFDAYDPTSLDRLVAALEQRTARHCLVAIHPPVVPYGARATWHLYSSARDRTRRERLLTLLGKHEAIVLGGHIHRYNVTCRETPGGGRFVQFALSSVIATPDPKPMTELNGLAEYTPDQIRVEPKHSPQTVEARRAVYVAEAPFVRAFEYADLPGHALVTLAGDRVRVDMYRGVGRELYRSVDLTQILRA